MRAGVFQCAGGGLSPDDRLHRLAVAVQPGRLDLVVCPELFMSGYHAVDDLVDRAEPCGGPFALQIAELARSRGTAIVYGYPERDGDCLYNSAACIDASGRVLANHRKLLLPPGFESRYFQAGAGLTLFDLNGVSCAILICYDAEFPEAVRAVAAAGAQVVVVPTALTDKWGLVARQMMPTRAFENGIWLLYANHAGAENGVRYFGASCIVAPDGRDACRAGAEEELIVGSLDPERVAAAQTRLPYLRDVDQMRSKLS